jgi:farnesyl-diphosphate farnesyltransferase
MPTQRREAAGDVAFCVRMLPEVSRTFALSIEALPEELREAVRVAYLLCRIVDTVEDGCGIAASHRQVLFDAFDEAMAHDGLPPETFEELSREAMGEEVEPAERELCLDAGAVFRRFRSLPRAQREAIRPHVQEMSFGMREYVMRAGDRGLQLSSMEDLEHYCYYVAGTVGNLLTGLFLLHVPGVAAETRSELEARAVSFGLGLQMVNIVKDVAADHERGGHCYLPLAPSELAPADLLSPARRDAALSVVRAVCGRAREHLERAREYTLLWPVPGGVEVRHFCAVPLALALATLDEVERSSATLRPGATPKVSRETVARVLVEARQAVGSDEALRRLFAGVQG